MRSNDIIILTGSCARGTNTEHSDIDLLCITENANRLYTETSFHNGKELQIIIVPRQKIHRMILNNTSSVMSVVVSMLKSSLVISDHNNYGKRLCRFIDKYNVLPSENNASSIVNILHSRCDELKYSTDQLEAQLLEADIMVLLLHLMLFNFTASSKSCIRSICKSKYREELLHIHEEFVKNGNRDVLLEYVHKKIDALWQDYYSTGYSLNNIPHNALVIVFFPKEHIIGNGLMQWILSNLEERFADCETYAFYQDSLQVMNEGTYYCISSKNMSSPAICEIIEEVDISISVERMEYGMEMVFPYYSSFATGYAFGGGKSYDAFFPLFSKIFGQFLKQTGGKEVKDANDFTSAVAVIAIHRLSLLYNKLFGDMKGFLINLAMMLLPDTVDPNGLYNVEQTKYLRLSALKFFSRRYEESEETQLRNLTYIVGGEIEELHGITQYIDKLCIELEGIDIGELDYPDIYPFERKEEILYVEIAMHILSILQLKGENKFSIIYNISRFFGLCLEDSLLQGR